MIICRVCLVTNVKMYNIMQALTISSAFYELTGISHFGTHQHICFECTSRLKKCHEFRTNCFKANEILSYKGTIEDIERDRKLKQLISPLQVTDVLIYEYIDTDTPKPPEALDYVEIHVETDKDQSFTKRIKYEIFDNPKEESDDNTNDISSAFEDESSHQNSEPKVEQWSVEYKDVPCNIDKKVKAKKVRTEKKKRIVKATTTRKTKSKVNKAVTKYKAETSDDGVPLMFKTLDKFSQFDTKFFEEYAVVTPMTFEDAKKEVELRKESSNYKRCPLKCDLCYRGYGTQTAYSNHMKKHSLAKGKFECEVCHLRFPTSKPYSKHMVCCHKRKFTCKLCPYTCFSITQAKSHIKFHKGVNYTCNVCQETFSMPNTLLSHKRIKHPTEVVCDLCGSTFASHKGLSSHNTLMHIQGETNAKQGPHCVECDVHFATETAWKRHLVLSAKHTVSFGCETCGDTFTSSEHLKSHVRSHAIDQRPHIEKTFPTCCTICRSPLADRRAYKAHMTSQHPQSDVTKWLRAEEYLPCVCEYCGRGYKTPSLLATHQTKHTGEKPYKCDVCERRFSFPATLSAHKKTHSADSKAKCPICNKMFQSKGALRKHEKISHLNIRPFNCNECGKSYHNLCEVKYHKQHAHGNVPWPKRDRSKRDATRLVDTIEESN